MRRELLDEYMNIYNSRTQTRKFRQNYVRMSELWMEFTDEERAAINRRLTIQITW